MPHVLAKDLRAAVLQAAMSGKLTKQLQSDTSVYSLLEEIEKDRKNRIEKKEIKKDKRLGDNNITNPRFDIPDNWKWTTLGAIVYKLTDGTHKTPKYTTSGVKFVSVKDMSSGKLSLENTKFISEEEHKELYSRCNPERGDIILSKVGTTGIPAIVETDEQFSLFVSVALLKFNDKLINRDFLYRLLFSPDVQQQAAENTKGIGNKNWVLDEISATEIPLPPIEEQARIVAKVDELMAKIDEYEKIENELVELKSKFPTDMKDAILQAAMEGKLVSNISECDGFNDLDISKEEYDYDLPDGWGLCHLSSVSDVYTGNSISETIKKAKYMNVKEGHNYIGTKDVSFSSIIDYENGVKIPYEEDKFKVAKKNATLLCIEGGSAGKKIGIANQDVCFGNKLCSFNPLNKFNPKYLYYFLQSPLFKKCFYDNLSGMIGGVSVNKLKGMTIPCPSIEEQQRIVEKLEQLLPLCDSLNNF